MLLITNFIYFMLPLIQENTINLTEIFTSIQGETSFTGLPTVFVRTSACNLRCSWCDTTYSFGRGTPATVESIVDQINKSGPRHVCITGGEPLLQKNVHLLMKILCDLDYVVTLETSGSLPIDDVDVRVTTILDIKCPGSQMEMKNLWKNLEILRPQDEVKFVVLDRNDYEYAKQVMEKYALLNRRQNVLISPVHGVMDSQTLVNWILEDRLPVRLNLQIHKFIWSPATRGV